MIVDRPGNDHDVQEEITMDEQQLDALREDVHKVLMEAGQPCGALCDDIAEHLIECGWRHPKLISR